MRSSALLSLLSPSITEAIIDFVSTINDSKNYFYIKFVILVEASRSSYNNMNERTLLQSDISYRHIYQTYDKYMQRLPAQKKWVREKLGTHLTWDVYVKHHLNICKISRKTNIFTPLPPPRRVSTKRKVRNVSFSKNFAFEMDDR